MRATFATPLLMCALAVTPTARALGPKAYPAEDARAERSVVQPSVAAEHAGAPDAASHDWSFGPYFRYVIVPAFMLQLFVDIAPTASSPGVGVFASHRSTNGGPSLNLGLGYTSYSFSGAFRAKNGVENDTEWIESSLGLVHLTGSLLWEAQFSSKFAFLYGVGLDIGVVTGRLMRSEAYLQASGAYGKCSRAGDPASPFYCQAGRTSVGGDPYNVRGEQYNIADQGIPPVMALPMLPQLALRYAPIPDLFIRLDAAYGIAQFWFGLSASYAPAL